MNNRYYGTAWGDGVNHGHLLQFRCLFKNMATWVRLQNVDFGLCEYEKTIICDRKMEMLDSQQSVPKLKKT